MRISDWSSDVCSSDLLQRPKRETLSIDEEPVEVGAVGLQVIECEDWAEDLLHVTDMLANADQCAGLCLDIGGGREMVGMGVGFQHHGDAPALVLRHRSEEHTSELQSLMRISYAVFCLKKKKNSYIYIA